jgi:putative peptide zinc metalloprotease protein
MNQEYNNFIVKKSDEIEIDQFNNSNDFIVTHKTLGNRVVINKKTLDILNLIDGKTKLVDVISKFNINYSSKIDIETAHDLLYNKLGKQGIIVNENILLEKKKPASYLSLSFTLVNEKVLHFFIKIISPFIIFKHFYKILFFSLSVVSYTVFSNLSKLTQSVDNITLSNWVIYFLISGGILFLHEFGHAAACKKLGAKPGNIGFGFYLLSPVMFADVSDIWKLKSKQRNYVNFAGLYIEIIVAFVLSITYIFFIKDLSILIICATILFSFIVNLNPFLRYDGYWIMSDSINTPNLRKVSMEKLKLYTNSLLKKRKLLFTKKDFFLMIYAFISVVFIFVFLAFILIKDPNSLLSFPLDIYSYIEGVFKNKKPFLLSDLTEFILPLLFYFIVIKFASACVWKFFTKK